MPGRQWQLRAACPAFGPPLGSTQPDFGSVHVTFVTWLRSRHPVPIQHVLPSARVRPLKDTAILPVPFPLPPASPELWTPAVASHLLRLLRSMPPYCSSCTKQPSHLHKTRVTSCHLHAWSGPPVASESTWIKHRLLVKASKATHPSLPPSCAASSGTRASFSSWTMPWHRRLFSLERSLSRPQSDCPSLPAPPRGLPDRLL